MREKLHQINAICGLTVISGFREAATIAFTLIGFLLVLVAPLFDIDLFGKQSRLGVEIIPSTMVMLGLFLAASLSYGLVARERKAGEASLFLSRSVGRECYVAGKLLGLEIVLLTCAACIGIVGIISSALWGITLDRVLVAGFALALGELALLGAAGIFFASIGSFPFIAIGLGILFTLGHLAGAARSVLGHFAHVFSCFVPRSDVFILTGGGLSPEAGGTAFLLAYLSVIIGVVFFFAASALVYRFREFS
ncbi:MAG: hypothetical protein ACYS8W_01480 [Planctomycetota bacterium]|jgi:ABC-type transport system involved in multi-copper enzyme maturation permease subunit